MVNAPTRIHLVRHGEVHNPEQILYGRLPRFGLNHRGRQQARRAAEWLNRHSIAALFSSPMLRARQTAQAVIDGHPNLVLHISAWLNEVHTSYTGRPGVKIDARGGDIYTGSGDGYEQPPDIIARTAKFCRRVRTRFAGGRVAAVTHGDIIAFMVLWASGFELTPANKTRLLQAGFSAAYPAHASITTLTYRTGDPDERPAIDYRQP